MTLHIKCAVCGGRDSQEKGQVLIYPAGNFHAGCKERLGFPSPEETAHGLGDPNDEELRDMYVGTE
jgi:hypothetical protein